MKLLEQAKESGKIDYPEEFYDDLKELSSSVLRGNMIQFAKQLNKQIGYIKDFPPEQIWQIDSNEKLKNVKNFTCYSLRLKSKGFNVRFLVTYIKQRCVLLVAFNEIGGKGKSSYKRYVDVAYNRLQNYNATIQKKDGEYDEKSKRYSRFF